MDNIAGPPVEGDNFFGRTGDVERLLIALRHHDILLLGPRRVGKTSVARAVMAAARRQQWRAIEINVASSMDERGFLEKLEAALREEINSAPCQWGAAMKSKFGAFAARIKSVKVPIPGAGSLGLDLGEVQAEDWTQVAGEVLTMLAGLEERWLIYIDELPIFLYNIIGSDKTAGIRRVRRFLDWFRNDVRNLPGSGHVRWLVSGSVGLDTLVQQHGMADTINSLKHDALPAFSRPQADDLLGRLASEYGLPLGDDADALLDAIQWLQPYYIQLAFSHLRILFAAQPEAALAGLIEQAVERMVQPGMDNDLHFWEERLFKQLPHADAGHAVALLTRAAATRPGERPEALLALLHQRLPDATAEEARRVFINLRDILQRDAYWMPDESGGTRRYRFLLEPLRRWWNQRNTL